MAKTADKVEKPWSAGSESVAARTRVSKKKTEKKSTCSPCRTTRLGMRILFWYAVFLLLWKCPYGSELSAESPALCGPLHCGIQRIEPVVKPYYDTYAEPYVMLARPYYSKTVELKDTYVVPAGQRGGRAALAVYNRFLAPHVDTARAKAEELYETHAREHHEVVTQHYNRVMQLANQQYERARIVALTVYMDHIQPVLVKLEPHYDRAVKYLHSHVCPRVKAYSLQLYYHIESVVSRGYAVVAPKIQEVWDKNVEPQLVKIRERVSLYRHKSQTVVSTAGTVIIGVENPTDTASETPAASVTPTVDTTSETVAEDTLLATPVEELEETASATEDDADEAKITPFKWPGAPEEKDPAESALQYWKKKVTKQLEEAQLSLNEEVNAEKARLLRLLEPQFTEKLQHLSDVAQGAYITIDKVVADIIPHRFRKEFNAKYGPVAERKKAEDEPEDEYDEAIVGTQIRVEPSDVQATFKAQADLLREGAMDVRELASELAQTVIDRTEKVRLNTLEVLDEFAEFALKELAKTVVNTESFSHWKEYKQVKDSIIEAKERMEKSDIPMEDVNGYLREVQETANHLAREAAQALNGLRSKSDFYFQERHRMEDSERVAKGEALADETPEGVEFYEPSAEEIAEEAAAEKKQRAKAPFVEYDIEEEEGEEEEGGETSTYTMTQTQTRVVTMSTDVKPVGTPVAEEKAQVEEEVEVETPKETKETKEAKKTASSYGDFDEEDYEDEEEEYDY